MTIEHIKELNQRLTALLADPQPGFISWCRCLDEVMTELSNEWNKKQENKDTPEINNYYDWYPFNRWSDPGMTTKTTKQFNKGKHKLSIYATCAGCWTHFGYGEKYIKEIIKTATMPAPSFHVYHLSFVKEKKGI